MSAFTLFTSPRRISRIRAFLAQGVTLAFAERSWSGMRADDRSIVIAMRAADVKANGHGYSCLLWSPAFQESGQWLDRPSRLERLQHCRLAALHRTASGLIAHGEAAEVDRDLVASLRVHVYGGEYWATWGDAGRMQRAARAAPRISAVHAAHASC